MPAMNENIDYPAGQLARAFVTALTHEDRKTRRRADERAERWQRVLRGMADGTLTIGSRAPVAGLPAWVTPEVVRGGFATGTPAAGGPLADFEVAAARRAGIAPDRQALFLHHLTDAGLAELTARLDDGRYEIAVPEEAALLTVAYLIRVGDRAAALALLDEIGAYAGLLRFTPRPGSTAPPDPSVAHRLTVGEVRHQIAARPPNRAVDAMREALLVWNPFADELLEHWLRTVAGGRVGAVLDDGWYERGRELLARYERLAAEHRHCGKHRDPKENPAILLAALADAVRAGRGAVARPDAPAGCGGMPSSGSLAEHAGFVRTPASPTDGTARPESTAHSGDVVVPGLTARRYGLLRHAVESMVRRRGRPGSAEHTALRDRQAADAARPTRRSVAMLVAARLAELPQRSGTPDIEPLLRPVTEAESLRIGGAVAPVPAGTPVPEPVHRAVQRVLQAPIDTLIERGVVPSAEVLAELVPQIVAATTAAAYPDDALRRLMAAGYRAFRDRRSLLLVNLEHQVQLGELPWVRAVESRRRVDDIGRETARSVLVRLSELALHGFPGTILPNPLLQELKRLAEDAGMNVPFVEELAADIFQGTFSGKYLRAAQLADELLGDESLYARYYGIDYRAVRAIDDVRAGRFAARTSGGFAELCRRRAGSAADRPTVAAKGMVIEQAQILTTHNLAVLVGRIGAAPPAASAAGAEGAVTGWGALAERAFGTVCRLVGRIGADERPLAAVKDAAYAWRQTLFFLSLCGAAEQRAWADRADDEVGRLPAHVARRLAPVLFGLRHVIDGGSLDDGVAPRFTGWIAGRHWMLSTPPPGSGRPPVR